MESIAKLSNQSTSKDGKLANPVSSQPRPPQQSTSAPKAAQKDFRVEHQFLNKMPDINSVENDLMKLLNDFSETRLKKYGRYSRRRVTIASGA